MIIIRVISHLRLQCLYNNLIFCDLRYLFWPYRDILIADQKDKMCLCMEIGDLFLVIGTTPHPKWKLKYHKIQIPSGYSGHYRDWVSSSSSSKGINDISILQSRWGRTELLIPILCSNNEMTRMWRYVVTPSDNWQQHHLLHQS